MTRQNDATRKPVQSMSDTAKEGPETQAGPAKDSASDHASCAQPDQAGAAKEQGATQAAPALAPEEAGGPIRVHQIVRRSALSLFGRVALLSLFVNLLTLAVPVFVLQVYDRVLPHAGYATLHGLLIGIVALIGFDFILRHTRGQLLQRVAMLVDIGITRHLMARVTGLPTRELEARGDSEWRGVLRDADTVRDFVAGPPALLLVDLPFVFLFIGVVAVIAAPIAWVMLALVPIYAALAYVASIMVGQAAKAEQQTAGARARLVEEIVTGRSTIKALGLGAALRQRWEKAQASAIACAVRRGSAADKYNHLGTSMAMLTTVVLTTIGAVAIIDQQMSIGGLIAANMIAGRVAQPMVQLIQVWRGVERYRGAVQRLDAILARDIERSAAWVERPRPQGLLTAEKATFRYSADAQPVLSDISLTLRPGAVTGIMGENGCGKSTLLKLLQGLYAPDAGRITLDCADLAQAAQQERTRWFGYVPQEPFLFAGTIRDNIVGGREGVSDDEILRAAELAQAAPFIASLPDGYGTQVGEGGRRFSPGYRQRIALARALVGDPSVLLLDEPSANLDLGAEQALCAALAQIAENRSVVIVSHSTALLQACDSIIVMHEGRIAMVGDADDVLPRQIGSSFQKPEARVA
ncbi:MAG: peptidase domain-containing ABC transporter [Neomegalonema sp.]|nr:peptidase domain-containing ABC transporter [Neomegalonema sp.]